MPEKSLGSVKLSTVKKAISQLEKQFIDSENKNDDLSISFEYIIASFFPKVLDNIRQQITNSYIDGYNAAWEEINSIDKRDDIDANQRLN